MPSYVTQYGGNKTQFAMLERNVINMQSNDSGMDGALQKYNKY